VQLDDEPLAPARVAFVLVRHAEEVSLVVLRVTAVGPHPRHAAVDGVPRADDEAARDDRAHVARERGEPRDPLAVHRLGLGDGVVRESGQEGLRQHDEIGRAGERPHEPAVQRAVRHGIAPERGCLHESDGQIAHRRSAAAASVASRFAKQKRMRRCSGGVS
jgi:hypothetical protein